jgi:8-oxo-dGTP pyrophosphatase MutT (NUDIX family)
MFFVNARAIIERTINGNKEVVIQWRNKPGEECWEFPGGRIEEYESFYDAVRREVKEETGLDVIYATGQTERIQIKDGWVLEGFKPYSFYQTLEGGVDSLGAHFICHATGELLSEGDDSKDIKWVSLNELKALVSVDGQFGCVDKVAALMYLKDAGVVIRERACAIVLSGDKLMFMKQGVYGEVHRVFVGGAIEVGETDEQAVLRELMEEANVEGQILFGPVIVPEFHNNHVFVVDIGNQIPTLGHDPELPPYNQDLKGIIWADIVENQRIFNDIDMKFVSKIFIEARKRGISEPWMDKLRKAAGGNI